MRSAPPKDKTAIARIRDSALALFGREGFDATSVRSVADAAGVSAALVIHHFGSKTGLRAECDRFVVEQVTSKQGVFDRPKLTAIMQEWLSDLGSYGSLIDYLSRMLVDGSDAGQQLFDELVASTDNLLAEGERVGAITASSDPGMRALLVAVHGLSSLVFARQIGRTLGTDGLTPEVMRRMTVPTLELYTGGLYPDESTMNIARAALADDERNVGARHEGERS